MKSLYAKSLTGIIHCELMSLSTVRKAIIFLILLSFGTYSRAEHITMTEARIHAENFINSKSIHSSRSAEKTNLQLVMENTSNNDGYYAFEIEKGGFVIVSSNTQDNGEIIGYSTTGNLKLDSVTQTLFDSYITHPYNSASSATIEDKTVIEPLIKTKWNQSYPFNSQCPYFNDEQCVTGCVATAMAQIMNYHQWPPKGTGVHSYEWNNQTLTVDLNNSTYNWDLMLDEYDENSPQVNCDAVAQLMKDCGYSISSSYTTYGTGGAVDNVYLALINYFNYNPSISFLERSSCTTVDWENILLSELKAQRPVMYSGAGGGAHEFICDGYDGNGLFHFNFGWGGVADGYFKSNIAGGFYSGQSILYGIEKYSDGRLVWSGYTGESQDMEWKGNNRIDFNTWFRIGCKSHPLYFGVGIENTVTHNVIYLELEKTDWLIPSFNRFVSIDAVIPDGDYIVYPVGKLEGYEWQKFYFSENYRDHIDLSVKNGVKYFSNPPVPGTIDEGKIEYEGIYYILHSEDNTAEVTYRNARKNSYSGDYVIPESITVDGINYKVTVIGQAAFGYSLSLGKVTLPSTITTLKMGAFSISGLSEIDFGENPELNTIEGSAFNGCNNLTKFRIPNKVTYLPSLVFQSSGIEIIDIPSSITSISNWVFTACTHLKNVIVHWTDLSEISTHYDAFDQCGDLSKVTLSVPKGTKSLYEAVVPWNYFNIVEETSGIELPTNNKPIVYTRDGEVFITNISKNDSVRIFDINGVLLFNYSDGNGEIRLNTLDRGVYIITVGTNKYKILL